jgi:hypothetical protein
MEKIVPQVYYASIEMSKVPELVCDSNQHEISLISGSMNNIVNVKIITDAETMLYLTLTYSLKNVVTTGKFANINKDV